MAKKEDKKEYGTLPLDQIKTGNVAGYEDSRAAPETRQERSAFEQGIAELTTDIAHRGLLDPLIVWIAEDVSDEPIYVLVAGHRRLAALKALMLMPLPDDKAEREKIMMRRTQLSEGIPVHFRRGKLFDVETDGLASNLHRRNLSSFEVAKTMAKWQERGVTGTEIARKVSRSNAWVSKVLNAYKGAGEALKKAWRQGLIPDDTIFDLAQLPDSQQAEKVAVQLALRAAGKKGEARASAKGKKPKKGKFYKAQAREIVETLDGSARKSRYVKGVLDAMDLFIGGIKFEDLDDEFQEALEEAQSEKETEEKPRGKKAA